jgi:hypothetical protein
MYRHAASLFILGVLSLALVPLMWVISREGLGSMAAAERVADTIVIWFLAWGLVAITSLAAVTIAVVCFSNAREELRTVSEAAAAGLNRDRVA